MIKRLYLRPSNLVILALVASACSDSSNGDRNKYNSLVADYNELTKNTVNTDASIQTIADTLANLNEDYREFVDLRSKAHSEIEKKNCGDVKDLVDVETRAKHREILSGLTYLVQGGLKGAFNAMLRNRVAYKNEILREVDLDMKRAKMEQDLDGMRSDVSLSLNILVKEYNRVCVASLTPESAEAAPTPPTAPDHSELNDKAVISDSAGKVSIISRTDLEREYSGLYNPSALSEFSKWSDGTGGFLGFAPKAEMLPGVVDEILKRILNHAGTTTDIAILLDTTSSMGNDIQSVKENLDSLLKKLEPHAKSKGLKISLVEYRDADSYISHLNTDFTDDMNGLRATILKVNVEGGGDTPEAILDAMDFSISKLSWRDTSSKSIILIGDAPGHPTTIGTTPEKDKAAIEKALKASGINIIVYPILVGGG